MSALAEQPSAGQLARPVLFEVVRCGACGQNVTRVPGPDRVSVLLDHQDVDGEWYAVKVNNRWRVVPAEPGKATPVHARRYAGHRCSKAPVRAAGGPTSGPCAGACGERVPRRYGPDADVMCPGCRASLPT